MKYLLSLLATLPLLGGEPTTNVVIHRDDGWQVWNIDQWEHKSQSYFTPSNERLPSYLRSGTIKHLLTGDSIFFGPGTTITNKGMTVDEASEFATRFYSKPMFRGDANWFSYFGQLTTNTSTVQINSRPHTVSVISSNTYARVVYKGKTNDVWLEVVHLEGLTKVELVLPPAIMQTNFNPYRFWSSPDAYTNRMIP